MGSRPSPALVVAVLALVAALAGTAVAADPLAGTSAKRVTKKKVKKIADKQIDEQLPVGTENIADGAVSGPKIAGGSVGGAELDVTSASDTLGLRLTGRRELNVPGATGNVAQNLTQIAGVTFQGSCTQNGSNRTVTIQAFGGAAGDRLIGWRNTNADPFLLPDLPVDGAPVNVLSATSSGAGSRALFNGWLFTPAKAIALSAFGYTNVQGDDCVLGLTATGR